MAAESIYLCAVLIGALVLFYTGWVRTDVTALLVMLAMMIPWRPGERGLEPVLAPARALSGFGSPALIMVASMFVLSAAMMRTGAAQLLGGRVLALGSKSELSFHVTVLVVVTVFSAFVNDTTTVLVWMPLVLAVCREKGYAPSRVLILLAYASLLGGQWTLIGTRSNIIVSDYLRDRSGEGLAFFAFTPVAVGVFAVAMLYFVTFGRRFLPKAAGGVELERRYEVGEFLTEALAAPGSELIGKTLEELDLDARFQVTVLQVIRGDQFLAAGPWLRVCAGDVLVVQGGMAKIAELLARPGIQFKEELQVNDRTLRSADLRMVEAVVAPRGEFVDRSLGELDFHHQYGVSALAISHQGRSLRERPLFVKLEAGDSLLLVGHETELRRLRRNPNLVLLESVPVPPTGRSRAYLVLALVLFIVLASATGFLAPAVAVPLAAVTAVLTGCIAIGLAYEAVNLQALVTVGGMISFGLALEDTGTAHSLAHTIAAWVEGTPHVVLLGVVLLMTVLLTQLIENAAVAIIIAPVAYEFALSAGCDPEPFLLGVAICVSAAFMTPMAHESTILVMGPGRYTFRDYLLLGAPLGFLTWLTTTLLMAWWYPLAG